MTADEDLQAGQGLFGITTAAELVGLDAQSLRLYEKRGLLEPGRTPGGTRRYSTDDVARLRRITALMSSGINIAGVAAILELEAVNADLRAQIEQLRTS
ncbi:MAG: MerR family transcriptional regulator [Actinomycetota bacterium]|nr:MAG: MerR family transcriptional regulator [Actinomycetota bacterium]